MEKIIYWIWLSILDFSQIEKIKLIEIFESPDKMFNLTERKLKKITDSKELIDKLTDKEKRKLAEKILAETVKQKIKIITIEDENYSERLKNIYDKPFVIYAKGDEKLLNAEKTIAIVGSRNCSEYGKIITQKFSYLISRKGYTVVSGLAKGIDGYAHKGTLVAKEKTIAVLGSGINYIYPEENKNLYKKILQENGLIISEYPLFTKPRPEYFPARNRIISGLADKILVSEATKKSGSIITANLGAEQGKQIYAIPGNILSLRSEGTNELIKDGAILVTSLEDILDL